MTTQASEFFKDISSFQDWKEFKATHSKTIRAENKGGGEWGIYLLDGDVFVFDRNIFLDSKKKNATCEDIYSEWLESWLNDESDDE